MSGPTPQKKPSSCPSKLLSEDQNDILFKLLGPKCQAQVSAVVQVFGTDSPNHNSWVKRCCGIVTFTKDNCRRSYFIQVFDIQKELKLFEQELYNQFSYYVSVPFFHQFEGDNQMVGLNFADNEEADCFSKVVHDRLAVKQRKKEEKRRQMEMTHSQSQIFEQQPISSTPSLSVSTTSLNKTKKIKNKKIASKISKDQIGKPTNFQHITHVGFDEDKGFSHFNVDKDLDKFFEMAGVSHKLLQDNNTRKFIYDFIDQHGGIEKATQESKVYDSIKRKDVEKPTLPARSSPSGPPAPPPRPQMPPPTPIAAPPPPPKATLKEKPDRPQAPSPKLRPSPSNPPPPPPPRLPISENGAPPAPPAPPPPPIIPADSLQDAKTRNDLLAQIRQKPTLNPVSQKAQERPHSQDSRSNLMSEIRNKEYELKHVDIENSTSPSSAVPPGENSMAAMLAQALMGRAKGISGDSDSSDDDDDEEDEWDDT